jgi:hypothetical protein
MKSSASGIPTTLSSPKKIKTNSWQVSVFVPLLATLGVGLLAVSSDSFWIDEGLSAVKAIAPTPTAVWQELRAEANTNLHMLLYMFSLWAWEKLVGPSEWALRALNIPFYMLGVTALWQAVPRTVRPFLLSFCLVSPFLWFYLNEARTYSMLFGFSAVATAALLVWQERPDDPSFDWGKWGWVLALSLAALIWTHVVGLVFELAVAVFLVSQLGVRNLVAWIRQTWPALLFLGVCNLALLAYVAWTKAQGIEANPIGKTSWLGVLYWLYEFGGFSGVGPNRNSLRSGSWQGLASHFPLLVILGLAWLGVFFAGWKKFSLREQRLVLGMGAFLVFLPLLVFLMIGLWQGIRFLPRYAAASFPAFAVLASLFLCAAWTAGGWRRWACLLCLMALGLSCLSLRFNPAHAKDDYRGVARWLNARKIPAETVWWAADTSTIRFYGMPGVVPVINFSAADLDRLPSPAWIVLSKVDVYDIGGNLRAFLQQHSAAREATFVSFEIFRLPPARSP